MLNKNSLKLIIILLLIAVPSELWSEENREYSSSNQKVSLLELYVSEGCSSCPPAQEWVSQYIDDPRLWNEIIPLVFHVNYWDYLGWKDPFASEQFTQRQYQYNKDNKLNSVYTPGFIVNGKEWRGWFQRQKDLPKNTANAGKINARLELNQLNVVYEGKALDPELNIVILGFDAMIDVKSGENRNRTLKEDFIVLAHKNHPSDNGQWSVPLPAYSTEHAKRFGIALWVNNKGNFTPLQAIGGWLQSTDSQ